MGNATDTAIRDLLAWDDNPEMSAFRESQKVIFAELARASNERGEANHSRLAT